MSSRAMRARSVVAVERDRDLVPVLNAELADLPEGRVRILEGDAQTVDRVAGIFRNQPGIAEVLVGASPSRAPE